MANSEAYRHEEHTADLSNFIVKYKKKLKIPLLYLRCCCSFLYFQSRTDMKKLYDR